MPPGNAEFYQMLLQGQIFFQDSDPLLILISIINVHEQFYSN